MKRVQFVTASSRKGGMVVYMGQKLRDEWFCDRDVFSGSACSSEREPFLAIYMGPPRTDSAGALALGCYAQGPIQ